MEQGKLIGVNKSITLPCMDSCPFGRACVEMYRSGECVERIQTFMAANIMETPQESFVSGGKIVFKTSYPKAKISVSNGRVDIKY